MEQEVADHLQTAFTTDDGRYTVEILNERVKQLNLGPNSVRHPNGIQIYLRADENEGGILQEVHIRERLLGIPIPRYESRVINAASAMIKHAQRLEERTR